MRVEGISAEEFERHVRKDLNGKKAQRSDLRTLALENPTTQLLLASGVEDRNWVEKKCRSRA
eukprot:7551163-Alexandrium_andersonii.AAC.1